MAIATRVGVRNRDTTLKRLKAALLGLTGVGETYLQNLQDDQRFELVALGDPDTDAIKSASQTYSICCFEDCRSLIVETIRTGLDVLFVALEPYQSIEFVALAARNSVAVYHKPPFARSVVEGRQLIQQFEQNRTPFVVSRLWPVEPAIERWGPLQDLLGPVFCACATIQTTDTTTGWRGDQVRSGGGVLLNGAYEQINLLVHLCGIPQSVYAGCSRCMVHGETRNYDTEDAVNVILNFTHERTGSISARRGVLQSSVNALVNGTHGTLNIQPNRIEFTPTDGSKSRRTKFDVDQIMNKEISAFATVCLGDVCSMITPAKDHLSTLAVIEAAYLSAKTGQPESPQQFLNDLQ